MLKARSRNNYDAPFKMRYCVLTCAVLCVLCTIAFDRTMKIFLGGYYVLLMAQFLVFCFQYPFTCSMDFRYIVPTLLIGALFIGIFTERMEKKRSEKKICKTVHSLTVLAAAFFAFASSYTYLLLAYT